MASYAGTRSFSFANFRNKGSVSLEFTVESNALTNQSIEEISEIFDASEEQEKAAKASDVEMEWSADKMQQFLNGEGIDQDADHSAESQQS